MRIGFDAKRLFNNFTGLGNYSRFVVNALSAHAPENEYWLYTPKRKAHPETQSYLDANRFTIRTPESKIDSFFSAWWRSVSLAHVAARDQVDIFHGLSNELPFQKEKKLKTVLTVHDLIFERFPHYYKPLDVQIYRAKLKHSVKTADLIIAVSEQTASDLVDFMKVDRAKIRVVYQGCHPNFERHATNAEKHQVKTTYQLPDRFVLYVGTLEERKNAAMLLRAIANLKDPIPVVFIGKSTEYMTTLTQLVNELKLEKQIQFLHKVAFEHLPAIYQMAEVFVYPSLFEGFGIPIVEAVVSGVPVITSKGSCFSEAGGPATRYVNPTDADALANELTQLLANRELRDTMVRESQVHVKRFKPAVIAADLMRVYRELI